DLPIIVLAQTEAELKVAQAGEAVESAPPRAQPADRERWNDYGIGLLLQGDLRGAEAAFKDGTQIEPGYAGRLGNCARAAIAEGDLTQAQSFLEQALKRSPDLARAHFFEGQVLKSLGRYDEALEHFKRTHDQYPRDRVVLNEMGRVQFLQEKHAEAVATL